MRNLNGHLELCAVNTATFGHQAPLEQVVEEVARAGFGAIAPWRREVEGHDAKVLGKRIRDAGLGVTAYCRSTNFTANTRAEFLAAVEDNKRALRDAASLGASAFALVVGTLRDLPEARKQVGEALHLLLPEAKALGVKLALEPLHPVYAADRACINTIGQGLALCEELGDPIVGLMVDAYHVWWDPNLARDLSLAKGRIFGFHVSDWLMPVKDLLLDRGMMGDGIIDLPYIRGLVEDAGYEGMIEVEIFSSNDWWKRPIAETCQVIKERLFTRV